MARPKIGLALGSGGAKGMAHIGVLKVLEQHGIPIDYIAGSSMGSLVASLYASGIEPNMIEQLAINLKRKYWVDLTVPKMGFVKGDKIKEVIRLLTKGKNIEQLELPLAIVATDIEKGESVIFRDGSIAQAVRASISIPGIFIPERVNGRLLVDGGVLDRVPISVVRNMGAERIIAVNVSGQNGAVEINSIYDVISQTIDVMESEVFRHRVSQPDIMIEPDVGRFSTTKFAEIEAIISEGEQAAQAVIDQIKKLL